MLALSAKVMSKEDMQRTMASRLIALIVTVSNPAHGHGSEFKRDINTSSRKFVALIRGRHTMQSTLRAYVP